ncbi:hypothetical protein MP228_009976 [Amoeboaphelidium protococcarum]|nr:hypothetical protein MP228_009976 [Amoeboaphelidium protococcarum]
MLGPLVKSNASIVSTFQRLISNGTLSREVLNIPLILASNSSRIDNQYIIKLKDSTPKSAIDVINQIMLLLDGSVVHRYTKTLNGFSVQFPAEIPIDIIRRIPYIEYIEQDFTHSLTQVQQCDSNLWGLDRIDQAMLPLDRQYTFDLTGNGVNVYIVDSGMDTVHPEFTGRSKIVFSTQEGQARGGDCSGHGTHVAGIIGGVNTGVAKQANMFSLQVFDCADRASNSDIVAALEYVTQNYVKPALINMSLGPIKNAQGQYPRSQPLDAAIGRVINLGISVFAASGNDNLDGCDGTPAGTPNVFTVGASDSSDRRASFSNYGSCVSLFAPGQGIVSTAPGNQYLSRDGTSQATPFAAGVAALYLQRNPNASPEDVKNALISAAQMNVVRNAQSSPNRLLKSFSIPEANSPGAKEQFVKLAPPGYIESVLRGTNKPDVTKTIIYAVVGSVVAVTVVLIMVWFCNRRRRLQQLKRKNQKLAAQPFENQDIRDSERKSLQKQLQPEDLMVENPPLFIDMRQASLRVQGDEVHAALDKGRTQDEEPPVVKKSPNSRSPPRRSLSPRQQLMLQQAAQQLHEQVQKQALKTPMQNKKQARVSEVESLIPRRQLPHLADISSGPASPVARNIIVEDGRKRLVTSPFKHKRLTSVYDVAVTPPPRLQIPAPSQRLRQLKDDNGPGKMSPMSPNAMSPVTPAVIANNRQVELDSPQSAFSPKFDVPNDTTLRAPIPIRSLNPDAKKAQWSPQSKNVRDRP